MADPRMNSVHLEAPRRAEYRRARDLLMQARGSCTIAAENPRDALALATSHHTAIQNLGDKTSPASHCWLVDKDYIYPLKIGINTVGRSPDNDVIVQDAFVSRRHCAILVHSAGSCEVHDTASKNGTFLNGAKISGPTLLAPGDEIRMCDQRLVFVLKASPPDPLSPTHTLADFSPAN